MMINSSHWRWSLLAWNIRPQNTAHLHAVWWGGGVGGVGVHEGAGDVRQHFIAVFLEAGVNIIQVKLFAIAVQVYSAVRVIALG
jgi:hypothetical protein